MTRLGYTIGLRVVKIGNSYIVKQLSSVFAFVKRFFCARITNIMPYHHLTSFTHSLLKNNNRKYQTGNESSNVYLLCNPGMVFKLRATVDKTMNKTEMMASIFAENDEFGFSNKSHIFLRRPAQHVTPRNSSPSRSAIASSSRRFSSLIFSLNLVWIQSSLTQFVLFWHDIFLDSSLQYKYRQCPNSLILLHNLYYIHLRAYAISKF